MRPTCTRRLEFDSAHRVTRHGSKCRNLHGHRYVAEVTCEADDLDDLDMVVDFGRVKELVGGWLDEAWDHGFIHHPSEERWLVDGAAVAGWKVYEMPAGEPTAENMAAHLLEVANDLLSRASAGLRVVHVRLYETPNCWADARLEL